MAKPIHWRALAIGVGAIGSLVVVGIVILVFARVGGVRGKKAPLYVTASSATGLLRGSEVHLSGKRIGLVEEITFRAPAVDTSERLLIRAEILEDVLPLLRRNSVAQIRPSGTIIGAPVVSISAGTSTSPPVGSGDTLRALPQVGPATVGERVARVGTEIGGVMREWRSIAGDIRTAQGTFGALRVEGPRDLAAFRERTAALMRRLSGGRGTIALTTRDYALRAHLSAVLASMDSLGAFLSSDEGNLGRFRRDSSLYRELDRTRAELAAVRASLVEARGTAGRVRRDRALRQELDALGRELDALISDVKKNPFRYIAF